MKTYDLEYLNKGLLTSFFPNTPAGETAWREMAAQQGDATIFTLYLDNVLAQLRHAGYSVRKAKPGKGTMASVMLEIDELLNELNKEQIT